jgi:leucyl aminopeptidase
MKLSILLAAASLGSAVASPIAPQEQEVLQQPENDLYLIELSPGETRWIAEDDKWALRRVLLGDCLC